MLDSPEYFRASCQWPGCLSRQAFELLEGWQEFGLLEECQESELLERWKKFELLKI